MPTVLKSDERDYFDLGSATLLSLQSSASPHFAGSTGGAYTGYDSECPREQAVFQLPPPSAVPPDARSRFYALAKLMQLEFLDVSQQAESAEWGRGKYGGGKEKVLKRGPIRRFASVKLTESEPKWMVFATCKEKEAGE